MGNKQDKKIEKDHLTIRIKYIIQMFNKGESFTTKDLAKEFNITLRTAQRDVKSLSEILPLEKRGHAYFLSPIALGKLTFDDIERFAIMCGVKQLFPNLSSKFIVDILNDKVNKAFLVKNQGFEDITKKSKEFKKISASVITKNQISYIYNNKKRIVNPYKLVNKDGSWYLVADEENRLKTYSFNKIKLLESLDKKFEVNNEFIDIINKDEVNWFSKDELIVSLEIDDSIMEYFQRKKILPNYTIVSKNDIYTTIKTKVSYEEEILSVVQYWIPNIRIVEPSYLQEKLNKKLMDYAKTT